MAMEHLGVTDDRLRSAVAATQGSVGVSGETSPPLSDEARDAIDCAIGLCREHRHRSVTAYGQDLMAVGRC